MDFIIYCVCLFYHSARKGLVVSDLVLSDFEEIARLFSVRASDNPIDFYVSDWKLGRDIELEIKKILSTLPKSSLSRQSVNEELCLAYSQAREKLLESLIAKSGLSILDYEMISNFRIRILKIFYSYLYYLTFLSLKEDQIVKMKNKLNVRIDKKRLIESFRHGRDLSLLCLLDELEKYIPLTTKGNKFKRLEYLAPSFPELANNPIESLIKLFDFESEVSVNLYLANKTKENVLRHFFPRNIDDPGSSISEDEIFNLKAIILERKRQAVLRSTLVGIHFIKVDNQKILAGSSKYLDKDLGHKMNYKGLLILDSLSKKKKQELCNGKSLALVRSKNKKIEIYFKRTNQLGNKIYRIFSKEITFNLQTKFIASED